MCGYLGVHVGYGFWAAGIPGLILMEVLCKLWCLSVARVLGSWIVGRGAC